MDTGDWVRVHYAPDGGHGGKAPSSAAGKELLAGRCTSRPGPSARPPGRPRPRRGRLFPLPGGLDEEPGNGGARLPEEARYLASLPLAKAIAVRLATRAAKERARGRTSAPAVTARWAWPPLVAAVVPALVLLIVALA